MLTNKETLYFELAESCDSFHPESMELIKVPCPMNVAQVSPLLRKVIQQFELATSSFSSTSNSSEGTNSSISNCHSINESEVKMTTYQHTYEQTSENNNTFIQCRIQDGVVIIRLSSSITSETINSLLKWMTYHVLDEDFEKNCRFAQFGQDKYEKEQEPLLEKPCFYDWYYITKLAGGGANILAPERRDIFYSVMLLADQFELQPLVMLGGKYLCQVMRGKKVEDVRQILGLVCDLTHKNEHKIRKGNKAFFYPQPSRNVNNLSKPEEVCLRDTFLNRKLRRV